MTTEPWGLVRIAEPFVCALREDGNVVITCGPLTALVVARVLLGQWDMLSPGLQEQFHALGHELMDQVRPALRPPPERET